MLPGEPSGRGSFELVAVGDISLGDAAQGVGAGVHAAFERRGELSPRYPFEHTTTLFDGASIVFGNLETVVSHKGLLRTKASSLEMRGHPDAADRLAQAGFTVLNVANNHIMQHGPLAFADTVESLQRHNIGVVGLASSDRRACVPHVMSVGGVRVSLLGFAFEPDKYWSGPLEYAFGPECEMASEVARAKETSDIVICSMHWGVEFVRHPARAEEELGRQLIDAGADIIIGHHPHVARRIDRYRHGLIAYSLGNFVFDQVWNPWLRTGLVLRVRLSSRGVESFATNWIWIDDDYQPRPLEGDEYRAAAAAFEALAERPEWVAQQDEYARRYEELVARNRHETYRHFVRNLPKRPLTYTVQTLLRTARRKALGR